MCYFYFSSPCSIGLHLKSQCDGALILKADISHFDQKLLKIRTDVSTVKSVCTQHHSQFVKRFESRQKSCSFIGCKKKTKPAELRAISYEIYSKYRKSFPGEICLVPGKLICTTCRVACQKKMDAEMERRASLAKLSDDYVEPQDPGSPPVSDSEADDTTTSLSVSLSQGNTDDTFLTPPEVSRENLNKALAVHNLPPADPKKLKNKGYSTKVTAELQKAITGTALNAGSSKEVAVNQDAEDFQVMIRQLQEKFQTTKSLTEKFAVLSILPRDWTHVKAMETFKCSRYMISKVKNKVKTDGILCKPNTK